MPETVRILEALHPLDVKPEMPVFSNTNGRPIEPNSFLKPWYRCLLTLDIRVRGLYAMNDTNVSTALTVGVDIAWLEARDGRAVRNAEAALWEVVARTGGGST